MALLETTGLGVSYAGLRALDDVTLRIDPGTFVGLIGPNGAGKTTCIDALSGLTRSSGTIAFDGQEMDGLPAHRRAALGMVRTFQSLDLFEDLTVRENLRIAAEVESPWAFLRDLFWLRRQDRRDAVDEALALLDLLPWAEALPGELSHGQRKLVGVARALAAKPTLLLLDEPAAGLDSTESRAFGARMRSLVDRGLSILVIEHDMDLVFDACDYVYVLEFGKIIAEGTADEIRSDQRVIDAYLGSSSVAPGGRP